MIINGGAKQRRAMLKEFPLRIPMGLRPTPPIGINQIRSCAAIRFIPLAGKARIEESRRER